MIQPPADGQCNDDRQPKTVADRELEHWIASLTLTASLRLLLRRSIGVLALAGVVRQSQLNGGRPVRIASFSASTSASVIKGDGVQGGGSHGLMSQFSRSAMALAVRAR